MSDYQAAGVFQDCRFKNFPGVYQAGIGGADADDMMSDNPVAGV
jgi:hypothetical protein